MKPLRIAALLREAPLPLGHPWTAVTAALAVALLSGCGKGLSEFGHIAADVAGGRFLGAEKGVLFYTYDTLAYPGEAVDLACDLRSGKNLRDLEGAEVAYSLNGDEIGRARTDGEGRGVLKWTPPEAGNYLIQAKIVRAPQGDEDYEDCAGLTSTLVVAARPKSARFVVIDLDHTVVASSFYHVMMGDAEPMAESVRVTNRIAGQWTIIYLTHRPDLLTRRSKEWLRENKYPVGPLLTSELADVFGDSGKFKTARLQDVRKTFPNVEIGIGDKISDAQSYVDNGLTAYLIPYYKEEPKDLRKVADQIEAIRGEGRLNVVDGWREVEAGLFDGERYPPERYVRELRDRADRLEDEKKAREQDD